MKRTFFTAVPVLLLGLAVPLAGAEGIKIGNKIPYADPDSVRDAIRKKCDIQCARNAKAPDSGALVFKRRLTEPAVSSVSPECCRRRACRRSRSGKSGRRFSSPPD